MPEGQSFDPSQYPLREVRADDAAGMLNRLRPLKRDKYLGRPFRVSDLCAVAMPSYVRVLHRLPSVARGSGGRIDRRWSEVFDGLSGEVPLLAVLLASREEELEQKGLNVERPIALLDQESTDALAGILISTFGLEPTYLYFWEGLGRFPSNVPRVYECTPDIVPQIHREGLSPTLWWGSQADWFIATDIDSTSTYVGSAVSRLVEDILDEPHLESYKVSDAAPLDDG
jgi:hypothetical protein